MVACVAEEAQTKTAVFVEAELRGAVPTAAKVVARVVAAMVAATVAATRAVALVTTRARGDEAEREASSVTPKAEEVPVVPVVPVG